MKLIYLLFSFINYVSSEKIIKNINIPSCKNCIHFRPSFYDTDFSSRTSECHKFANKDIITDKISYDSVEFCRNDESKCGKDGKYFETEKNIYQKIFFHKLISNIPNNILTISILLTFYLYLIK